MMEDPELIADRYEVIARAGEGALGKVYRAFDPLLKKEFAVKVLGKSMHGPEEKDLLRFQQEARVISRLSHNNIVGVYNFGLDDDDVPYLVLEFLDGRSLSAILKEDGALDLEVAIDLFVPICDAMGYAHDQGVVHRDLKPSNVIVTTEESGGSRPVVVDFGIAKFAEMFVTRMELEQSTEGLGSGTPYYMSPEQCDGLPTDWRSDIYSLGCMLYQCLTGRLPIEGETLFEVLEGHRSRTAAPMALDHESRKASIAIEEIVFKALSKDPDSRFQSMGELRDALIDLADLIAREREPGESSPGKTKSYVIGKGAIVLILGILVITGSGFAVWRFFLKKPPVAAPPQNMPLVDAPKKDMYPDPDKSDDVLGTWLEKYAPADNEMFQWTLSGIHDCDLEVEKAVRGGQIRRKVFVDFADLTDRGLKLMTAWPLSALGLRLTEVSDTGLAEIGKFADLEYLSLIQPGSTVSSRGIAFLPGASRLKTVLLGGSWVDDRVTGVLRRSPCVEEVMLEDCRDLSARGFLDLTSMKSLKRIRVYRCRYLDGAACEKFRKARPDVLLVQAKSPAQSRP
ncbi:MAG: serine/threonine protein kinase [Cyanobacteria bacterium HKST-UBA02]|nr:serine/threonine protein kinase [Cyanobacteria bacterium HKST-UBA02]